MFLKRLENDGAKIGITEKDRVLLKNYDKDEEEIAEYNLEQAIRADANITQKDREDEILEKAKQEEEKQLREHTHPKERNPESLVEKLRLKRLKASCSKTKAVAVDYKTVNAFQQSKMQT